MSLWDYGSSPLTRGKPTKTLFTRAFLRLIPAHAGKTGCSHLGRGFSGAHPRSRGENDEWVAPFERADGSSPLTRGKRQPGVPVGNVLGLIPAHAGKTQAGSILRRVHEAHPRSRGENGRFLVGKASMTGSSPLTRGKRAPAHGCPPTKRLIPAHAGKTKSGGGKSSKGTAHPRSRGENVNPWFTERGYEGSSPLTRGKLTPATDTPPDVGLIPAHAGKTASDGARSEAGRAHPRSRGENHQCFAGPQMTSGSSPLTRGKLRCAPLLRRSRRLIPAHAGKTPSLAHRPPGVSAHPRSRGENTS